jgi:uncharacterized oxidoreductase
MKLTDNTILITGGTSGFGFEFASRLIALGNTVIITGRNAGKLEETKQKLPAVHTIQSDVRNPGDIIKLYNQITHEFPTLNILINNAGEMRKLSVHHEHTLDEISREIEINLIGPIRMVQEFLPHLKKQKNAAIVNVTSGIALMPFAIAPIYSASKSGLRSYTQTLRIQLKNTAIKVIELVAPGSSTPLNEKFKNEVGFNPRRLMVPGKVVEEGIRGIMRDKDEIFPGFSKVARIMSRLAPRFLISQAGKVGASFIYGKQ